MRALDGTVDAARRPRHESHRLRGGRDIRRGARDDNGRLGAVAPVSAPMRACSLDSAEAGLPGTIPPSACFDDSRCRPTDGGSVSTGAAFQPSSISWGDALPADGAIIIFSPGTMDRPVIKPRSRRLMSITGGAQRCDGFTVGRAWSADGTIFLRRLSTSPRLMRVLPLARRSPPLN